VRHGRRTYGATQKRVNLNRRNGSDIVYKS
jgi:hypothetical protein